MARCSNVSQVPKQRQRLLAEDPLHPTAGRETPVPWSLPLRVQCDTSPSSRHLSALSLRPKQRTAWGAVTFPSQEVEVSGCHGRATQGRASSMVSHRKHASCLGTQLSMFHARRSKRAGAASAGQVQKLRQVMQAVAPPQLPSWTLVRMLRRAWGISRSHLWRVRSKRQRGRLRTRHQPRLTEVVIARFQAKSRERQDALRAYVHG